MKHTETNVLSVVTDTHLENALRIATTSFEPNIDKLGLHKQTTVALVSFLVKLYSYVNCNVLFQYKFLN